MSKANHKCPSCNSQKTPETTLTAEGLADDLVREFKYHVDVKYLISEYKEASREFKSTFSQLKRDVREFAKKRGEEIKFFEKRKYAKQCIAAVNAEIRSVAGLWGQMYKGAIKHGDRWERERRFTNIILGETQRRDYYRIRNGTSYLHISI